MSLFNQLGGQQNPMGQLQQLKANPVEVLKGAGFSVPSGMNNPQEIINHLLQSGQINNPRLQMAQMMARRMGIR